MSGFPVTADSLPTNHSDLINETIHAADINNLGSGVNAVQASLLPGGSLGQYNVKQFGAFGDGVTNDTAAIQAAINAANSAGGGIVFLPAGVYLVSSNILPKSNTILRGAGRWITRINCTPPSGSSAVYCNGISGFGIEDLAIQIVTNIDFCVPLQISSSSDGRVDNVRLIGGTHAGMQLDTCSRVQGTNIYITANNHNSGGTGGTGLWLYHNTVDCEFTNVFMDSIHGTGLSLDAGTTDGLGIVVQRNTLTNIVMHNVCTAVPNKAVEIEGASRNVITGLIVDGCGVGGVSATGIQFNRDQAGISSDNNVIVGWSLKNITGPAVNIIGGSGNVLVNGEIGAFNTNNTGSPQAFTVQETTAFSGSDASDNLFRNVVINNTGGGTYQYSVVLSAPTRHLYRNKFEGITWGGPSSNIILRSDTEGRVPLNGIDANIVGGQSGFPLGDNVHDSPLKLYGGDGPPSNSIGVDGDVFLQDYPRLTSGVVQPILWRKDSGAWVDVFAGVRKATIGPFVFLSPVSAVTIVGPRMRTGFTVTAIYARRNGGTGATLQVRRNGSLLLMSSALSLTTDVIWTAGTGLQNTVFAAGDTIEFQLLTVAGTPADIELQVDGAWSD